MGQFDTQKDYYSVLGAQTDASRGEIERLYKRQAQQHHPDLAGGDEERMKSLNEAYGVLRDDATRRAYDAGRQGAKPGARRRSDERNAPPVARAQGAQADAVYGRCVGAILLLAAGLVLLLLVRFQWIWFLWPLAILAGLVMVFGVLMARSAMLAMRESLSLTHPARRHTLVQEAVFWSIVCGGGYGVYLVLSAV
ncbi:MAG: molecular chaperone DnaJ [Blastocatellia bacterium]|nr:molecular chaperone DnaJ [Blastocatellia bacterium]